MFKRIVKYFTLFLMVLSISFAQADKEEILLTQILEKSSYPNLLNTISNASNVSQILQDGDYNEAVLSQQIAANVYSNGTMNLSFISQLGSHNEASITQVVESNYTTTSPRNTSYLTQTGDYNKFNLSQVANDIDKTNYSDVTQTGSSHTVTANMTGSGNKLQLEQRNTGNEFALDMIGNNNSSNIIQDGAYNILSQYIEGNSKSFDVIQTGRFNELNQIETGVDGINYSVQQKGPGMKVTIVNGSLR